MADFEYTPEITEQFKQGLRRPVEEAGARNVGNLRGQALRRGLEGDPFESQGVAMENRNTQNALTDIDSNMAYNVAGMQREERMGQEQFGRQKEMFGMEAAQQEKMANLQFLYQKQLAKFADSMQRKSAWMALPGQIIGGALGTGGGIALGKALS